MNPKALEKKLSQIIAKCWADEGFKRKLLADTAGTLKAEGVELPSGLSIKALENRDTVFHLVIPAKPAEMSDDDLDQVAGGFGMCHVCFCGSQPPVKKEGVAGESMDDKHHDF